MSIPLRGATFAAIALMTLLTVVSIGPAAAAQQGVEESAAAGFGPEQSRLAITVVMAGVAGLVLFGVRRLSRGRTG